ncbi:MAG: acetyl-CoA carboxylase biotin carboxylase subunit [Acidobacteria bacterium]|nr:acetyl-CoA carboxylase biotin carboxylase subunit [Acidobacteriota bacterium]MDW7983746.1 acetyl-CoA carboxylase biotin carboxylase subunit [Acidobacteriota bacterium]
MVFRKVLIANRGEIAVRIIAACRDLGIRTVAVYSEADREAMHVLLADEAICVGPPPATESYLNIPNIISAAEITGAEAIHPGYGFLSENADFAEICESCHIRFIGPPATAIRKMGDKAQARQLALEVGVPVIPGSEGTVEDEEQARKLARKLGYPVLLKAAAGGGGKGMRIVRGERELETAFRTAQAEAARAFGRPDLYMEKYLIEPRHIEVQVLADAYGNAVYLFERECSIQRRHQKVIEEAPSPVLTPKLRQELGEAALRLVRAVGYVNAGTLEFLVDRDGHFYFIEANTRIQVEHPVTEMITGIDIVRQQIRIAAGEALPWTQADLQIRGHAIECRVCAEDPWTFMPSAGTVTRYIAPQTFGVRIDTALYSPYRVPPYYDSLLAKVIAWGEDRAEAIARMARALTLLRVEGIRTNIPLHLQILEDEAFHQGRFSTQYLESVLPHLQTVASSK